MKKIFFIISLLLVAGALFYHYKVKALSHEIYMKKAEELKKSVENAIVLKKENTETIAYILSQDMQLKQALQANKNGPHINYSHIIDAIRQTSKYHNIWIQLIDTKGNSLYRSWNEKTGDNLLDSRIDLKQAIAMKKPVSAISTGKFDMTIKTIMPIFDKGKFLGIFELISHFDSIAKNFLKQGIGPILVINKSYSRQIEHPFSKLHIGAYYISNRNAPEKLLRELSEAEISQFMNMKAYMLYKDTLVSNDVIYDIKKRPMGNFLLFTPLSHIDMAQVSHFKINYLLAALMFMIIISFLFLILNYKGYVKKLSKEVEKKTRIIQTKSNELEALVATYDDNVIFSQTDLHGIITKVSKAFCDISGYSSRELIGKPHNIVRHPDMPKAVFRRLWKALKREKWVKLEIKNLKKDGGYYWVSADMGPLYDKEGRHIGYSAVRQDITANKDIEEMQKEIIHLLSAIGESHSVEVAKHVKRVAAYCKLLAHYCELPDREVTLIEQASPLHDIGKIAIPDAILNKAAPLDEEEYRIMQTHTTEGFKIFNISERPLLKMAATIALEHHERWDGKGYPNALKGENISIGGRITALADVFDALSHERCYKDTWPDEEVFDYIRRERGKHFDPMLVDIFFEHLDEFLHIREKYRSDKV